MLNTHVRAWCLGALCLASATAWSQAAPNAPQAAANAAARPAPLAPIAAPKGKVILVISGSIDQSNVQGGAKRVELDAQALDALPVHQIKTGTPWHKEVVTFSGPRLSDLLALVGARGENLQIKALNDYQVKVPVADAAKYEPILARKIDGNPLSIREKGPLFMMYPFDAHPELRNDIYFGRAIWQIATIDVK